MDDIVTRLRTKYQGQLPICAEAADEIERLKKELNKLIDLYNYRVLNVHNALNDLRNQELNLPIGVTIRWGFLNELYEMQMIERATFND